MTLRFGVLAWQIGQPAGVAGYAARLDTQVAMACAAGAELLLMPEYAPLEAAHRAAPDAFAELDAACDQAPALLAAMQDCARRHRVWLVPGSLPMRLSGGVVNRAPLIAPDGRVAFQDKRQLTPWEIAWGFARGAQVAPFETPWGRIGIAICYDAEFPTLVRAQIEGGAWLVLVPAATDTAAGASRIRIAARARALENQCFVAVSPTVGDAPWLATLDASIGRAGVYGPMDHGFPADGIIAEGDGPGWIYADLDRGRIDSVRNTGAVRNHRDWPA